MANTLLSRKLKRVSTRLLMLAGVVYLAVCTLIYFEQNRLEFPGAAGQGTHETQIRFGPDTQKLQLTTRNGIQITAVFGAAAHPGRPTILYFYGNGGCAAWSQNEFNHFRRLDCNVLIPDLPGYGQSSGNASEANFYAAADAAFNYLQTRPEIDSKKMVVVGWSMGAAIAIDLASRKPVAGLATFNGFTSLPAMARGLFPWAPTGALLKYKFDNESKIAAIHCPMLICNGTLDTVVPPSMSDRLAGTAGGRVTRLIIPSADHNTIFIAEPDLVWDAMQKWIDGL